MLKDQLSHPSHKPPSAALILENGDIFWGNGIGSESYAIGELCFNTSQTGYEEILTDPSYAKQIITFTHPHIGNTGINQEDNESKVIHASGMVVKNFCETLDFVEKPILGSDVEGMALIQRNSKVDIGAAKIS